MDTELNTLAREEIENRIFTLRGLQVMIDRDLAEMYGIETKRLNEQVRRNIERFPSSFMFQLTESEWESSRSQIATLNKKNKRGHNLKYLPFAFSEQGVAMLSAVLRSDAAIKISIQIMNAFVEMRKIIIGNAALFQRLDKVESRQLETEQKFEQIFKALESKNKEVEKGVFFEGQIFDAYTIVAEIIKKAEKSIIIIDNYVDESVLLFLTKRKKSVKATIYTKQISKQFQLDLLKHNAQYPAINVKILTDSHDRFLIIDQQHLYHIGASLKDLGKKWFAFSKMNSLCPEILNKLN